MIIAELIRDKIQEVLGAQYNMYVNDAFNCMFVNKIAMGYAGPYNDVNYQAFEQYADRIVGVVTYTPSTVYNASYRLAQGSYTLQFWVPKDVYRPSNFLPIDDPLYEPPKFNFYADMERLKNALDVNAVAMQDGDITLRAFFTISEPSLFSPSLDVSGAYRRATYQVSGAVSMADSRVGMGTDVEVALVINGTESKFKDIFNFQIGANTDANANLEDGGVSVKQDVGQSGLSLSFSVDEFDMENNPAVRLIDDKAFSNINTLSPAESDTDKKLKVLARVYKRGALKHEFYGILSAEYAVKGKSGFGAYNIVIADDGSG